MKKLISGFVFLFTFYGCSFAQSLEEYNKTALANNPGLQYEYKLFEATMQRAARAGSLPDPTLSFGYFISPVETRVGAQKAKFSLSQMFPWFGTLKAKQDALTYEAEAAYQVFIDSGNKLLYEVATAYYRVYEIHKLIELEKENISILRSMQATANSRYQSGEVSLADVIRADIMLDDSQSDLYILEQKEFPLRVKFNKMLNLPDSNTIELPDSLFVNNYSIPVISDSLFISHPRLKEIELKINSSKADELAANRQGLPSFGLGIDYAIVQKRTDMNVPDNGKDIIMPMISVGLPIFRGKYKSAIKETQLKQQALEFKKQAVTNQLNTDYESILFRINQNIERIKLSGRQISQSDHSLNILLSEYSTSGKSFDEVLRMQQQLLKYRKMKIMEAVQLAISIEEMNYLTSNRIN